MSYSKKRIEYNNKWPDVLIEFSAENDFKNLMRDKGITNILLPVKLPIIEDFHFQRLLSFKIDIYEQLPYRPDIAFDLAWRTFEAYSVYFSKIGKWTTTKTYKILDKTCEDILINQINNNAILLESVEKLLNVIPLQATEFLTRRLFQETTDSLKSQQTKIRERVEESLGKDFIELLETKYKPLTSENQRKCGLLIQKLVCGNELKIDEQIYNFTLLQRMKFLINGILYSYRNERFHGDSFSPFKSSQTKIKTFAHSYYCLITTYFFITKLMYKHFSSEILISDIISCLDDNVTRFDLVFEKHLKK